MLLQKTGRKMGENSQIKVKKLFRKRCFKPVSYLELKLELTGFIPHDVHYIFLSCSTGILLKSHK